MQTEILTKEVWGWGWRSISDPQFVWCKRPVCSADILSNLCQRKTKGGGKTRGGGETYHKTPPQKRFWTPPLMIRFPPPPLFTQCHSPQRKRAQTRQIPFSKASKTGFGGGALWYVFPPPPKIARYVLPPPFANSVQSMWIYTSIRSGRPGPANRPPPPNRPRDTRKACPRGSKRCFLNGVFQSGVFRGWSGSARVEGTKMLENNGVFKQSLSL